MAKALRRLFGAITAVVMSAVACVFFGLQSHWFSDVAGRWVSARMERPVEIGQVILEVYPRPAVVLKRITFGASSKHPGRGDLRDIRLLPGASWIPGSDGGTLEVALVDMDESLLYDLTGLSSGHKGEGRVWLPFSNVSVPVLAVRNARNRNPTGYRLKAKLTRDDAGVANAELHRLDGHMTMTFAATKEGSPPALRLVAHDWAPPLGPAFHFDKVSLSGTLSEGGLDIRSVKAEAYKGRLTGHVRLTWDHDWAIQGELEGDGLQMAPVIEYYGGRGFDGLLTAKVSIKTRARDPEKLLDGIRVEGPFLIRGVVIDTNPDPNKRMRIDAIHAKGKVDRWSFSTSDTLVEAYGGEVRGATETNWSDSATIKGRVKAKGVQLEPLLEALMARRPLSGRLSGDGGFVLSSSTFAGIFKQPDLTANLRVDKGIVFETDLEKLKEGQTPFRELKTRVRMKEGVTLLSALDIESDRLSAEGWVKVDRDNRLDGKIAVTLRNTISLAGANVGVGGTLDDPSFAPATSTIIGGVIGTGLLGPGWGTALGVRLGQLLDSVSGDESEMEDPVTEDRGAFKRTSTR
ncbi:MAG: hypothetical protein GC138_09890 [Gammaproteobacteria bacterium]|nr:hypothetical protein [Gammaproteobacteria bacterium]